jgi:hypothetical protein
VLSGKSYRFNVFTHFGLVVWLCHSCAKPLYVHCGLIPYFGDVASMRLLQFFAGHDAVYVLFFLASKGWLCYLASKELLPSIIAAFCSSLWLLPLVGMIVASAAGFEPLGCRLVVTVHTGGVLLSHYDRSLHCSWS